MTDHEEAESTESGRSETAGGLSALAHLLRRLHQAELTGELADLRRMDHRGVAPAAFFRLIARAGFSEMSDIENIHRWARAVHVMAQRPDALRADIPLGEALHRIGISESRLDMLLNARGDTLFEIVRRLSLRLARSEEAMPYRELCQLLLWSDRQGKDQEAERLRIQIAQNYVRAAQRSSGNDDESD